MRGGAKRRLWPGSRSPAAGSGLALREMLAAALLVTAACSTFAAESGSHRHEAPAVLAPGYATLEFEAPRPGSYALPPLGPAVDGAVLDSRGRAHRLHDLLGDRLVVLSFIYTRCSDVNGCPLASYVLNRLQQTLRGDDLAGKVRLLSLSFDPDYDSPAVLADYAERFRDPAVDWRFITTASRAELAPILDGYNQWVIRDRNAAGEEIGSISHLLRVYLIDRQRRIRNIYSVSFLHADTVANDIRTLLASGVNGPDA